jgi:hypothetical protein
MSYFARAERGGIYISGFVIPIQTRITFYFDVFEGL